MSAVGFVWKVGYIVLHQRQPRLISADLWVSCGVLLVFVVLFTFSWWRFHVMVNAAQGRLLFPLLGVIALTLAYGLAQLPRIIPSSLIAGLLICAALFPPLVIAPAYAINHESPLIPQAAVTIHLREPHKERACLMAWTTPARWVTDATQGDSRAIELGLWWQRTCRVRDAWSVFVHVVNQAAELCVPGETGYILTQDDSMPQRGNLPFAAMQLGQVYYDHYWVVLPPEVDITQVSGVYVGLYDAVYQTWQRVHVSSAAFTDEINTGKCVSDVIYYALPPAP
jgi:hypothetical protein